MQRLGALRRNRMNIDAHQPPRNALVKLRAGFFDHLTARYVDDRRVFRFHMPTRKQPSIQPPVMHQKNPIGIRSKHNTRASDMPRSKCQTRKRFGRILQ